MLPEREREVHCRIKEVGSIHAVEEGEEFEPRRGRGVPPERGGDLKPRHRKRGAELKPHHRIGEVGSIRAA
jgi:hypothetical protein